jgi:hypothetical protein
VQQGRVLALNRRILGSPIAPAKFSLLFERSPAMSFLKPTPAKTSVSGRALPGMLAGLLAQLLGACVPVDECQHADQHCDGDVAMLCVAGPPWTGITRSDRYGSSYSVWHATRCGAGMCKIDGAADPFCALNADPEPRCDGGNPSFCEGNAVTECRAGYVTRTTQCGSENHTGAFCVTAATGSSSTQAFCAADPEPNPLCAPSEYQTSIHHESDACEGNDKLRCMLGYVVDRQSCGQQFCRDQGTCVLSGDPEPSCGAPGKDYGMSFCEGSAMVQCAGAYRLSVSACGAGETCHVRAAQCGSKGEACTVASCAP